MVLVTVPLTVPFTVSFTVSFSGTVSLSLSLWVAVAVSETSSVAYSVSFSGSDSSLVSSLVSFLVSVPFAESVSVATTAGILILISLLRTDVARAAVLRAAGGPHGRTRDSARERHRVQKRVGEML